MRQFLRDVFVFVFGRALPRLRGYCYRLLLGFPFRRVGRDLRISGMASIQIGPKLLLGDGCWIEAVEEYQGHKYQPRLIIGSSVAISNWTHLSCASRIVIGDGCLIGSKVYIGDHNHGMPGSGPPAAQPGRASFPGDMPLVDLQDVEIGRGTWVGDGAVVLGGCSIAPGSIVGANSVVAKFRESRAALIAGIPARVVKYLDECSGDGR